MNPFARKDIQKCLLSLLNNSQKKQKNVSQQHVVSRIPNVGLGRYYVAV